MNKLGLIKFGIVLLTVIMSISFYFFEVFKSNEINDMFPIMIMISLTFYMYYKKETIIKFKFIYNVVLLLMLIIVSSFILLVAYDIFNCIFDYQCSKSFHNYYVLIFPILLFLILFHSIDEIKNKNYVINDILVILISLIIIIVHIRFYYDEQYNPNMFINIKNDTEKYYYVSQNYGYFSFMYFIAIIHKLINKK